MRWIATLAALPAFVIWVATPRPAPPLEAKAIALEGISRQAQDDTTFRARWSRVADMPPMTTTVLEPLLLVSHETFVPLGRAVAAASVRPPLRDRRASLRSDICARHNMRQVYVTKHRWRCRR